MPKLRNKVANTARRNIVDIVPFKGLECLFLYRFVAISSTSSYLWLITFVINSLRQPKATKDTRNKHTMPFKRKMSTYIPTSSINNYYPPLSTWGFDHDPKLVELILELRWYKSEMTYLNGIRDWMVIFNYESRSFFKVLFLIQS